MQREGTLRTCDKGHQYIKKSDCLSCPICENERKPKDNFMSVLSTPDRRALENNGITSIQQLASLSEEELLQFHGMGKSSILKLKAVLQVHDLRLGEDCV
jgi:predicted RecB family nuclease